MPARPLRSPAPRALTRSERPGTPVRPGRPPKFGRRARPVTITLPEDLIARLRARHVDLGRAIVEVLEGQAGSESPVQLADFGRGALILVPPASALKRVSGVDLIPLSNGRALIALDQPMSSSDLELTLGDALREDAFAAGDRAVVEHVLDILREARTSERSRLRQRTIIIVERHPSRARRRRP